MNMKKKTFFFCDKDDDDTVSLISGKAFQRRKPRDGFGRSNAAVESI